MEIQKDTEGTDIILRETRMSKSKVSLEYDEWSNVIKKFNSDNNLRTNEVFR
jgi:hypothetical protein